ncbi:MAG TPA: 30S ribosomal protein S12 methylthiotransferase RimO [Acidimicrobiales bacterium]|nr:30S ribosomal protein S12 methylthiotransferase RimO [Acidimicrobiales bacterium]
MPRRYWVEPLGCPKNQVDSEKLVGTLQADGLVAAARPEAADLVVVNTCAFIEAAREESINTVLALADARGPDARLVVTGCLAERYGEELARALPEADLVAGFGVPVNLLANRTSRAPAASASALNTVGSADETRPVPVLDLLNLPRPKSPVPWAYVKVAEGCDRRCGFCAIPSFRGKQRSRSMDAILAEIESLDVQEVVLVAQDLASYGRDLGRYGDIVPLARTVARRVPRTRLLYRYPSELTDGLIDVIGETGCPYFDLSLQHASKRHLRRMRRWGDAERFLGRIKTIRSRYPEAAFRSSFIVGYPGETEEDHDQLLRFLAEAELDWAGFFAYSREDGTYAADLPDVVDDQLVAERLLECSQLQDEITARHRAGQVGETIEVLIDRPGIGRSHREAPEIDGIVRVRSRHGTAAAGLAPAGQFVTVRVTGAAGFDLEAELV